MPLPEIVTPEFQTTLPSTGEKIFFRPFLVKEEKMLLMAQEGKDRNEVTNAVIKILDACIKTCLLYTSPSPRDAHESRMPSSA